MEAFREPRLRRSRRQAVTIGRALRAGQRGEGRGEFGRIELVDGDEIVQVL
jgi:hypothetical protein